MRYSLALLIFILFGFAGFAYADDSDESEDTTRSLTMTCDYSDYNTFQYGSVNISQTGDSHGKPAAVKKFKRGKSRPEPEAFVVRPGQFAECIYPSGTRVRAKVGEESARPYGECGGDPEVFMSLWVNKRKIVSRMWFAGHCREYRGSPAISFNISGIYNGVSVQKCHSVMHEATTLMSEKVNTKKDKANPLSVCVDFPDVSKYPIDLLEYPSQRTKIPKVGDIELLDGTEPVCQAVLDELKRDFNTFSNYPDQSKIKLRRPEWTDTTVELPKELVGSSESIFDFNNDGNLDRVFGRSYENTYMDGSVLLVQPGSSSSKLNVSAAPINKTSSLLPCQMGKVRHSIYKCPPFSQENDEAGFAMHGQTNKDTIYFRARYSNVSPFSFMGVNFIGVSTKDEATKDFVAVLKPLPDGTFQKKCLLRRVSENF